MRTQTYAGGRQSRGISRRAMPAARDSHISMVRRRPTNLDSGAARLSMSLPTLTSLSTARRRAAAFVVARKPKPREGAAGGMAVARRPAYSRELKQPIKRDTCVRMELRGFATAQRWTRLRIRLAEPRHADAARVVMLRGIDQCKTKDRLIRLVGWGALCVDGCFNARRRRARAQ